MPVYLEYVVAVYLAYVVSVYLAYMVVSVYLAYVAAVERCSSCRCRRAAATMTATSRQARTTTATISPVVLLSSPPEPPAGARGVFMQPSDSTVNGHLRIVAIFSSVSQVATNSKNDKCPGYTSYFGGRIGNVSRLVN